MYFSTKLISFREYDDKVATYVLDLIFSNYFDYITQTRQTYEHLGKFKGMERQYKMNLLCAKLFQWNQVTIGAVNGQVLKSTKSWPEPMLVLFIKAHMRHQAFMH